MKQRVTLKDIAKRLDLSISAISKALHHDPSISELQRERVQQVAEALGYRPDPGLTALAAYRLKSGVRPAFAPLAFMAFEPIGNNWTDAFFQGACKQAEQLGYQLNHYQLRSDVSLQRHGQILHSQGVRGLLVAPLPPGMTTLDFDWSRFCVVALGRLVHPALHRASPDAFEALLLAVDKVRKLGHRRIGIAITREQNARSGWNWTAAAAIAQESSHFPGEKIAVFEIAGEHPELLLRWLKQEKPDVVMALKHPVLDWIEGAGYVIPRDMAFVSLDYKPPMNGPGVEQNFKAVGAAGMTLLHASLIQGEMGIPQSRQTLLVQPEWIDEPAMT